MNTNEYIPVSNYLALTVKKENRLTVKKFSKTLVRVALKIALYLLLLTVANIFV